MGERLKTGKENKSRSVVPLLNSKLVFLSLKREDFIDNTFIQ
jgi:hypothetical protein